QAGLQSPSPRFSVPYPPSHTENGLHMALAAFLPDSAPGSGSAGALERQKMARVALCEAMRAGRQSWMQKLAHTRSELPKLPRWLIKVAELRWGYQQGWYQPQQLGGGIPQPPLRRRPSFSPTLAPAPLSADRPSPSGWINNCRCNRTSSSRP